MNRLSRELCHVVRRASFSLSRTTCSSLKISSRCAGSIGRKHMISIGDEAQITKAFTEDDIKQFSLLSGDTNPIHLNEKYATKGRYGKRVVHGSLTLSLVSGVTGVTLPGPGCILVAQEAEFVAPLYINEEVTCKLRITGMKKLVIYASFSCVTSKGKEVLKGKATLLHQPARLNEEKPAEEKTSS